MKQRTLHEITVWLGVASWLYRNIRAGGAQACVIISISSERFAQKHAGICAVSSAPKTREYQGMVNGILVNIANHNSLHGINSISRECISYGDEQEGQVKKPAQPSFPAGWLYNGGRHGMCSVCLARVCLLGTVSMLT
jgi:hypothetical protein